MRGLRSPSPIAIGLRLALAGGRLADPRLLHEEFVEWPVEPVVGVLGQIALIHRGDPTWPSSGDKVLFDTYRMRCR